jgi:predicted ATPase
VIESIAISRFRGIREGGLSGLTPLVVLVGPNGSGKSTIIEAALIGASPLTGKAIVQVIRRHEGGGSGPLWLLWRGGKAGPAEITVTLATKESRLCRINLSPGAPDNQARFIFEVIENGTSRFQLELQTLDYKYHYHQEGPFIPLDRLEEVQLVETYPTPFETPLDVLYTQAVQRGRRAEVKEFVRKVFPSLTNIEILTQGRTPILHIVLDDSSVPASLAGDGILSLLRLSLELAASGPGVAILEEPEVHQHVAALRQSARVILTAVRRGTQVLLTTHSLEFIDGLLAEASDQDLQALSLYRVQLQGGILKSHRLSGPEVAFSRGQIEDDLR